MHHDVEPVDQHATIVIVLVKEAARFLVSRQAPVALTGRSWSAAWPICWNGRITHLTFKGFHTAT